MSKFIKMIYSYKTLPSTNETAKALIKDGAQIPFMVVAGSQTHGKGRWGRYWWSPENGLWFSLVIPKIEVPSLRSALSVTKAIKKLTPLNPGIRWPNDVLVNGKKIGGILTESMGTSRFAKPLLIIGIGVNTNQKSFPKPIPNVTSLKIELGSSISNKILLDEFSQDFEHSIRDDKIIDKIKEHLLLLGEQVIIKVNYGLKLGEFFDIETDGSLLLREATGIMSKFTSSEVEFLHCHGLKAKP